MADAVRDKYPEVRINTLAYQMTENPPKTLRPRDNVLPRLCDTNANLLRPITHADNQKFAERLATWGQVAKQLRIWDYAVTYNPHPGLPLPTVHTYAPDYRYFAEHNVEGVFTEHEHAILADLRDLKIWMMIKLLEDPYRDAEALLVDFTDGFYGPAGPLVRRYLTDLQAAAESADANVNWFPALSQYTYLTLDFLQRAQTTFEEAEAVVRDDPVLLGRVRFARLPVDRACLILWPKLMRQWTAANGQPEKFPLDRAAIATRCRETWLTQIDRRFPESQRATHLAEADAELTPLLARPAVVPLPERFRNVPPKDVFDFTAEQSSNYQDQAKRVPDTEAESGITNRLELSDEEMEKYKLPMGWGAYAPEGEAIARRRHDSAGRCPGTGLPLVQAAAHRRPALHLRLFLLELDHSVPDRVGRRLVATGGEVRGLGQHQVRRARLPARPARAEERDLRGAGDRSPWFKLIVTSSVHFADRSGLFWCWCWCRGSTSTKRATCCAAIPYKLQQESVVTRTKGFPEVPVLPDRVVPTRYSRMKV